jgi:hypothetical protein
MSAHARADGLALSDVEELVLRAEEEIHAWRFRQVNEKVGRGAHSRKKKKRSSLLENVS